MDLSTKYLGFDLPHPIMPGANPLVHDLDQVRRLEDAGAAAIVLDSLFEEQIRREEQAAHSYVDRVALSHAEAPTFLPDPDDFAFGPDDYLEHVRRVKEAVRVPVIASLNGTTHGGWIRYARAIEQAGADALELNVYQVSTDPGEVGASVESRTLELVREVRRSVVLPIAVKLSPFWSNIANLARQLDAAGANGMVLFNRFYQPDFDLEALDVVPTLRLSDPSELLLRLHAVAVLSGRVDASLALTGGVHTSTDALKAVMAGAHAVQMVSAILRQGAHVLADVVRGMGEWLDAHEYDSLRQAQGSMSLQKCPDPAQFERGNYMRVLQGWGR